ncbi:Fc.00g080340.m01.CDS01 [Cosmosporella sp. VM-42]
MASDRHPPRGAAHKVTSVFLRLGQLCSAIIVLGILSRFSYLISIRQAGASGRVVYTMVIAVITIVYSFFLCCPFDALFMSFPVDFILFIGWLVAFCLLEVARPLVERVLTLALPPGIVTTGVTTGAVTGDKVLRGRSMYTIPDGVYVFRKYVKIKETTEGIKRQARRLSGRKPETEGSGFAQTRDEEAGVAATNPPQNTVGGTPY